MSRHRQEIERVEYESAACQHFAQGGRRRAELEQDIADAFFCTRQCVENLRKRLVTEGFDIALHGKKRETPPRGKCLDGEQEAKVIALRLSDPPKGRNGWTLRLLAEKVVELEIAPEVSHVTVQSTLKKIKSQDAKCNTG